MAAAPAWLHPSELRVGLGCMRLSTDPDRDERRAAVTIAAALGAGVTVFDTARAYGHGPDDLGHNERLLARSLRTCGAAADARIVTKGGMARPAGAWVPDGRAKAILADCDASREALGGLPIDLYLLHAPDPRTPWRTSLRALQRLLDAGAVRRIGVANVNLAQLDEALAAADLAAVSVALGPYDDRAVRGGVLDRCAEAGIAVIAHAPLGGPARAARLGRQEQPARVAEASGATPAEVAIAAVVGLSPRIVAVPGARRPETARSAARAARLELADDDRIALSRSFGWTPGAERRRGARSGEVVLVMGIPGAGKTRVAAAYADSGYLRLNRDARGGSLRDLAGALETALASGARSVVLDNTYLTRAERSRVTEAAAAYGLRARCVWIDVPLAQAQVNLAGRLLDRFGRLPEPDELRAAARREPGLLAPTAQMRALRELEPPGDDEGFAAVERRPFEREPGDGRPGVFVAAAAVGRPGWEDAVRDAGAGAPCLVFDWSPAGATEPLAAAAASVAAIASGPVATACCPHPGGPPRCWCRPPLPGLPLAFAREHGLDPARSLLVGTSPAHRALAAALGANVALL
jgi:aryl-alcohol dehydrogenase-like predicted oxidoreductase/predicted kinase